MVANNKKERVSRLIFGAGWLGTKLTGHIPGAVLDTTIIKERKDIEEAVRIHKPAWIINAVGKTGRPNIDWCESHKPETYFANVHVPYLLAEASKELNIPLLHISSGCIYAGDNNGKGFSETDVPNFGASYYSHTKAVAERLLSAYDNTLICRIRMPLDTMPNPRNLISKLLSYQKIIVTPNSITVASDLLRTIERLMETNQRGIFNCVNTGTITHQEIIELYERFSGKQLRKEYISALSLETAVPRSNCVLNTDKLSALGLALPPVGISVEQAIKQFVKQETL